MKSSREIVQELVDNQVIEKFVEIKGRGWVSSDNVADLLQDLYLYILSMPEKKLVGLYEREELNFYLLRMVQNQCQGLCSSYNKVYREWQKRKSALIDNVVDEE